MLVMRLGRRKRMQRSVERVQTGDDDLWRAVLSEEDSHFLVVSNSDRLVLLLAMRPASSIGTKGATASTNANATATTSRPFQFGGVQNMMTSCQDVQSLKESVATGGSFRSGIYHSPAKCLYR